MTDWCETCLTPGSFLTFFFFPRAYFFSPCVLDSHMWLSQQIQPPLDYHVTHKSTNNGSWILSIWNPLKNRGNLDTLPLKWPLSFFFIFKGFVWPVTEIRTYLASAGSFCNMWSHLLFGGLSTSLRAQAEQLEDITLKAKNKHLP